MTPQQRAYTLQAAVEAADAAAQIVAAHNMANDPARIVKLGVTRQQLLTAARMLGKALGDPE